MAGELEIKGKVDVVTEKAIKIGKDWYSTTYAKGDIVVKGDEVVVTYKQNKAFKNVVNIQKVEAPKVEVKEEVKTEIKEEKKTYKPSYDNPEKTAQIMKGNALNAAGAALGGNLPGAQPADIAEALVIVARRALEFLQE